MVMLRVCPKCFEPELIGHVCGGPKPLPTPVKQEVISQQKRKKYDHPNLKLNRVTVFVTFDIDTTSDWNATWLLKFIKDRCEIPEGPEDYPTIEDFYIRDARLG